MTIEILVGVYVIDENLYQQYRDGMLPILHSFGGSFGYDFKVSEVLKSMVDEPINRVFTISFESEEEMSSFFSNGAYLEIKKQFFEPSVSSTTIISRYQR